MSELGSNRSYAQQMGTENKKFPEKFLTQFFGFNMKEDLKKPSKRNLSEFDSSEKLKKKTRKKKIGHFRLWRFLRRHCCVGVKF